MRSTRFAGVSVGNMGFDRNQLVAYRPGKFGVELQHVDRKLHLVDDSLPRPMPAAEQFEVGQIVVEPVTVDVVDGFFGEKFASEVPRHDVPVLKNFVGGLAVLSGNSQDRVFTLDAPSGLRQSVFLPVDFARPFVFALFAAKHLFSVESARAFQSSFVKFFAAVFAVCFVSFISVFPTALVGTRHRAIKRVFVELFSVRFHVRRLHGERRAAFFAVKNDGFSLRRRSAVQSFVRPMTRFATKFSAFFALPRDSKLLAAMFASAFGWHGYDSSVGSRKIVAGFIG